MESKIVLQDIEKAYGKDAPVIEDLNLEIEEGSFTVLLGPSGCGKSTTLRMIAGLEQETKGTLSISGKDMKEVKPGDRGIAMVFQNYALYPTMTVKENIEFGLKNCKVPKAEKQESRRSACQLAWKNTSTENPVPYQVDRDSESHLQEPW